MKFLIAAVAFAVCACNPAPAKNNPPQNRKIVFDCTNGQSLSVNFFPAQGNAILVRNNAAIKLQQQPSGSGFIYSNGRNTIRGKGDNLTVEIGRMAPLHCRAR